MTNGAIGERERTYLASAISMLKTNSQGSPDAISRVVLFKAFFSAIQQQPQALKKLKEAGLDIDGLSGNELLRQATSVVTSGKWPGKGLVGLLLALEALDGLEHATVQNALSETVPSLLEASNTLVENRLPGGWEIRMFLANYFPEALGSPFKVKLSAATPPSDQEATEQDGSASDAGEATLSQYVDAAVRNSDDTSKLGSLQELLLEENEAQDSTDRLYIVHRLVQHLKGKSAFCSLVRKNIPINIVRIQTIRVNGQLRSLKSAQHILP